MTRSLPPTILALALGLLLATAPAFAAGPFDGTYGGNRTVTASSPSGCMAVNGNNARLVVANNVAHYEFGMPFDASIAADGSFSVEKVNNARNGSASFALKGRIVGINMEADVGGDRCRVHLSLKKM